MDVRAVDFRLGPFSSGFPSGISKQCAQCGHLISLAEFVVLAAKSNFNRNNAIQSVLTTVPDLFFGVAAAAAIPCFGCNSLIVVEITVVSL